MSHLHQSDLHHLHHQTDTDLYRATMLHHHHHFLGLLFLNLRAIVWQYR